MERHLQTILAAIVLGLVTWTGYSITTMQASVIRTEERVQALTDTINDLRLQLNESRQVTGAKIEILSDQIDSIDKRVLRLEAHETHNKE